MPLLQVHKACLHDGRVVAVKVQYLGLESEVAADMTTLAALSTLAGWLFPDSFRECSALCMGEGSTACLLLLPGAVKRDDADKCMGNSCPVRAGEIALAK